MNAKAIKSAVASDRVSLNRFGNALSTKRSILQLNEGFTNGYGQAMTQIRRVQRVCRKSDKALA
jgi:hypothetical protein